MRAIQCLPNLFQGKVVFDILGSFTQLYGYREIFYKTIVGNDQCVALGNIGCFKHAARFGLFIRIGGVVADSICTCLKPYNSVNGMVGCLCIFL